MYWKPVLRRSSFAKCILLIVQEKKSLGKWKFVNPSPTIFYVVVHTHVKGNEIEDSQSFSGWNGSKYKREFTEWMNKSKRDLFDLFPRRSLLRRFLDLLKEKTNSLLTQTKPELKTVLAYWLKIVYLIMSLLELVIALKKRCSTTLRELCENFHRNDISFSKFRRFFSVSGFGNH
jgi:hypothetical protein